MSHVSRDQTCREEVEEDKDLLGLMEADQVEVDREGVEHQVVGEAVVVLMVEVEVVVVLMNLAGAAVVLTVVEVVEFLKEEAGEEVQTSVVAVGEEGLQ